MRKAVMLGMVAAMSLAGCGQARSEDQGPAVDRNYSVANFDKIDLAGAYDVIVRTGSAASVKARGPEKTLERLVVEVRDGTLVIEPQKKSGLNWGSSGKVILEVTVPSLSSVQLAGAGDINIDRLKGDAFEGGVAGAGDLTIDQVEIGSLKLSIAGAGSARVKGGRAGNADLDIAGAGDIDTKAMTAETASVSIAGAGDVRANATRTASVSIMGAGDVEMIGGAKCTVSKAGGGDVRCS